MRSNRSAGFGLMGATAVVVVQLSAHAQQPPESLQVLLTTAPTLSRTARAAMMTEASTIWRQSGVLLEWFPPDAVQTNASRRIRALVAEMHGSAPEGKQRLVVGELLRPTNSVPIAMISIESARRLLASVQSRAGCEFATRDERRLGVVLGRALAHEIGHYLLGTATHARMGLMRPNFDAIDFAALDDELFTLDRDATTWLRTRGPERFSYYSAADR